MKSIMIPVSPAELLDRIAILEIKEEKFAYKEDKRKNVMAELKKLIEARVDSGMWFPADSELDILERNLMTINQELWNLEEQVRAVDTTMIRDHAHKHELREQLMVTARKIYQANDRRSAIKRRINELLESELIEEKSHL